MRETKLYSKLRPQLTRWGVVDRVENTLGSGMPDVYYNMGGVTGWLETKVAKGDEVHFEKFQPNWMRKHLRAGLSRIFVVVMHRDSAIIVYRAQDVVDTPMYPQNDKLVVQLSDLPPYVLKMYEPYHRWDEFRQALIS